MLPSPIDLDQATERREATIAELLSPVNERAGPGAARRALGRWFVAIGVRLAGEPTLRLARSPRG